MVTRPDAICCSFGGEEGGRLVGIRQSDDELESAASLSTPSPMFVAVHPDGEHCYAVLNHAEGEIRSVAIGDDGELAETARHPTGGAEPCYVSVDAAGEFAFVANYTGGTVSLFPIEAGGRLGERAQVIEHEGSGPDPDRQDGPYPHSIVPGPHGRFVYAADLGTDEIWCYELDRDASRLEPTEQATVEIHEGAGPRHIDFHPNGEIAYLLNELDSTLTSLSIAPESGELTVLETVDTLPADVEGEERSENYPADIEVHPSKHWCFCSNRGHDSIVVVSIDGSGAMEPIEHEPTGGEWPRDFALEPNGRYLFVENRRSDEIVTLAIDTRDGRPSETGARLSIEEPVCLAFRDEA